MVPARIRPVCGAQQMHVDTEVDDMSVTLGAMVLAVAVASPGGWFDGRGAKRAHPAHEPAPSSYPEATRGHTHQHGKICTICQPGGRIVGRGPGLGWGFANGNPDGYGWVDYGDALPLGIDRTPEYYFRRHYAIPPEQLFLSTYYNPYLMRGQRYIPYAGCGGDHPYGGRPAGSSMTPYTPATDPAPTESEGGAPIFQGNDETRTAPTRSPAEVVPSDDEPVDRLMVP